VERLEAKGILKSVNNDIRPLSRNRFVDYIIELDKYYHLHPDCLSQIEKEYFERLKGEFKDDITDKKIKIDKNLKEIHFYSLRNQVGSYLYLDLLAGLSSLRQLNQISTENIFQPYYGAVLRGSYSNIHFYSDNRIYSEWGRDPYIQHYNPSQGYPINTTRDSSGATWDVSKSYFCFNIKKIQFLFGRENVKWGPSKYGSLMFSGLAPDFDQLKMTVTLKPVTFIWLHGSLRSDFSSKWISAHRLAVSLTDRIDLGLNESVIYGERGLEVAYLNPIMPYLIAEHTLGDKDNVSLGFDCALNLLKGCKVYGELFIDDLFAPWELFSDYWGNKFAVNLGAFYINPLLIKDSDLRMEYTRIEPYVYTHDQEVNIFENYNIGLGSFLQPNSDCFIVQFRKFIDSFFYSHIKYLYARHGEGNRREPHKTTDNEQKEFLSGIVERYNKLSTGITGEIRQDCRFCCDVSYLKVKDFQNKSQNNKKGWEILFKININW